MLLPLVINSVSGHNPITRTGPCPAPRGDQGFQGQSARKYYNPRTQDQPLANILLAPRDGL